ncbi:MAG: hypothetical protein R3F19_31890 [Verrucomicrobiales bacterium]
MKLTNTLFAGTLLLALWSCGDSVSDSDAVDWPPAPDGYKWPDIKDAAMEFKTVANADLESDVKKAVATLKSRYSPDDVTFARSDLNADGRDEILIKAHHYGFAPSFAILSPDDSGRFSDIGWISGEQIFPCERIDGWQSLQTRSGSEQIRQLYSFREGLYHRTRSEQRDATTGTVTILPKTQAEGSAGQPATRFESDSQSGDKPQPESERRSQ